MTGAGTGEHDELFHGLEPCVFIGHVPQHRRNSIELSVLCKSPGVCQKGCVYVHLVADKELVLLCS